MRKRNSIMKEIDELEQTFKNTLREELWVSVYDLNEDILDLKELEVPTRACLKIKSCPCTAVPERQHG